MTLDHSSTTHKPDSLTAAKIYIAELEARIEELTLGEVTQWRRVHLALNVYPAEARILVGLYNASVGLSQLEMDHLLPLDSRKGRRKDEEFRTMAVVRQHVYRIRRLYPWMLEPNPKGYNRSAGTRLTAKGRLVVQNALDTKPLRRSRSKTGKPYVRSGPNKKTRAIMEALEDISPGLLAVEEE